MSPLDLPPDTLQYLDELVSSGEFTSRDKAIVAAIELLRLRHERMETLKASIQEASDQLDAGEIGTRSLEEILAEGRRILAERHVAR